ncbi:hypothetical protein [Azohydromonas australica]|uniref:hypothetical protein n=1 Tax=Azohydromonas australica TaxID=364039 RepID=UPI000404FF8E|nr:hypothetical protein [Azohydromonas australica]
MVVHPCKIRAELISVSIGIAANVIFVAPLAMLVAVASLNIGGIAPLAVFLLPPTLITILNIFVLIKTFKAYRAIEPQENQISNPKA